MASTQPDTPLDLTFFRFTGVALLVTALFAGAMTLSLTLSESRVLYLAQQEEMKVPLQLAASTPAGTPPTK